MRDGSKTSTPPNVPQLHPVECFTGSLKQAVYAGSWEASNIDQLKKKVHLDMRSKTLMWGSYETYFGAS